jgi:transcriptional regulator with XRE-family HTH domain
MDFTRQYALDSAERAITPAGRLRRFMKEHALTQSDLASIMRITPGTLGHWLDGGAEPPGVMDAVLDLLEECSCARRVLGVKPKHGAALRREELLRQVRAI